MTHNNETEKAPAIGDWRAAPHSFSLHSEDFLVYKSPLVVWTILETNDDTHSEDVCTIQVTAGLNECPKQRWRTR